MAAPSFNAILVLILSVLVIGMSSVLICEYHLQYKIDQATQTGRACFGNNEVQLMRDFLAHTYMAEKYNNSDSQVLLGHYYHFGVLVQPNKGLASQYYHSASTQGNSNGDFWYAYTFIVTHKAWYNNEVGHNELFKHAMTYFKRAKAAGHVGAYNAIKSDPWLNCPAFIIDTVATCDF